MRIIGKAFEVHQLQGPGGPVRIIHVKCNPQNHDEQIRTVIECDVSEVKELWEHLDAWLVS